jgi:two-component system, OmpR family, alkaline phosphatase synthesis response regulator PhoP
MNESILLVEDEQALRATLSDRLRSEGYVVDTAVDGQEGFDKAANLPFDLIILDVMLPRRSGLDVCRDIRAAGMATPILILTVRNETVDKVVGLKLGADDYVTKPFEASELMARVEALLRRVPIHAGQGLYEFGPIRVDVRRAEVTRDGKPVYLTAREFQLLRYLIQRAGVSVSRDELLRSVWGYSTDAFTRTVDTHIVSLRQKLEENPKQPEFIFTVSGLGYRFGEVNPK